MNNKEIIQVLECCLLASDEADLNFIKSRGINSQTAKAGIYLYHYLKSKKIK